MKTITCAAMGGMCDAPISGATQEELIGNGMTHLKEMHPEMAATISAMPKDDPIMMEWSQKFQATWDATPENA